MTKDLDDDSLTSSYRCFEHLLDAYSNGGNITRAVKLLKDATSHGWIIKWESYKTLLKAHIKANRSPHFLTGLQEDGAGSKRDLYKTAVVGFVEAGNMDEAKGGWWWWWWWWWW